MRLKHNVKADSVVIMRLKHNVKADSVVIMRLKHNVKADSMAASGDQMDRLQPKFKADTKAD
jgi:hypothetical protein